MLPPPPVTVKSAYEYPSPAFETTTEAIEPSTIIGVNSAPIPSPFIEMIVDKPSLYPIPGSVIAIESII